MEEKFLELKEWIKVDDNDRRGIIVERNGERVMIREEKKKEVEKEKEVKVLEKEKVEEGKESIKGIEERINHLMAIKAAKEGKIFRMVDDKDRVRGSEVTDEELRLFFEYIGWRGEKYRNKICRMLRDIGLKFEVIGKVLGISAKEAARIYNKVKDYKELGKIERRLSEMCFELAEKIIGGIDDELIERSRLSERIYAAANLIMNAKQLALESAEVIRTDKPLKIVYGGVLYSEKQKDYKKGRLKPISLDKEERDEVSIQESRDKAEECIH